MRIIGKRIGGEIAVYEVVGFRYYPGEDSESTINCTVNESLLLMIKGKNCNITQEQSLKYSLELFQTNCLNLLDEPVQMHIISRNVGVSINNEDYEVGVPVYIAGISNNYLSTYGRIEVDSY